MLPTQHMGRFALVAAAAVLMLAAPAAAAPVEVYAGSFVDIIGHPLTHHPIRVFDNTFNISETYVVNTNSKGFVTLNIDPGHRVFLILIGRHGWKETTTGISTVPPEGLTGDAHRIILQVPDVLVFTMFKFIIPGHAEELRCHVVGTVVDHGLTYKDCPQGYPGVKVTLSPYTNHLLPFYFGTFSFINKTNPFVHNLKSTSWDGGFVFRNVNVKPDTDVHILAHYKSAKFTDAVFRCMFPNQFINLAPNQGPRAMESLASVKAKSGDTEDSEETLAMPVKCPDIENDQCHLERKLWISHAFEMSKFR